MHNLTKGKGTDVLVEVMASQVLLVVDDVRGAVPCTRNYDIIATCALHGPIRQKRKGITLTRVPQKHTHTHMYTQNDYTRKTPQPSV